MRIIESKTIMVNLLDISHLLVSVWLFLVVFIIFSLSYKNTFLILLNQSIAWLPQ